MSNLGGSPLGLIGVKSRPTADGMSTFNGGRSRNVNVNLYNSGKEANKERLSKAKLSTKGGAFSLFTSNNLIQPWSNIGQRGNEEKLNIGQDPYNGLSRRTLHNNDVYDTSIINLIDKTANTAARLKPADFAYLKDLGVFPNNRLMIARRFAGPAADDIFGIKSTPLAVLITWNPTDFDFFTINFGEEWIEANASFTEVLNNIGKDLTSMDGLGTKAASLLGSVPLPGWTEGLQQQILEKLEIIKPTEEGLQVGNPNIVKEAKRRKTIGYDTAGSGLKCTLNIKMICEYEQKFISGIDPTIAYMDILSNIVQFGTSARVDYGLTPKFAKRIKGWVSNPSLLVSDFIDGVQKAANTAKEAVVQALSSALESASDVAEKEITPEELAQKAFDAGTKLLDKIFVDVRKSISASVKKYEEEIKGIVNALSLSNSTPWHISIGNPLRPIFSSGDMYTMDVALTLGPTLAFNDLPSSIKVDFTLTPARSWGLQDIMSKFNSGHLRTVNVLADSKSLNPNQNLTDGAYYFPGTTTSNAFGAGVGAGNTGAGGGGAGNGSGNNLVTGSASITKENDETKVVNSDPNSNKPVVVNENQKSNGSGGTGAGAGDVGAGGTGGTGPSPTSTTEGGDTQKSKKEKENEQADSQQDPTANANATSKRGYTYEIVNSGMGRKFVKVKDKNGVEVFKGPATATTNVTLMIDEAKTSLGDK